MSALLWWPLIITLRTGLLCTSSVLCSCFDGGAKNGLRSSDAVFVGAVLTNHDTTVSGDLLAIPDLLPAPRDTRWHAAAVRLRVLRGWKDPGAGEVTVIDLSAGSSCADYLPDHRVVIVYARMKAGSLLTWGCGADRNRPLVDARDDLKELGPYTFSRVSR
jgi:hypothetical protein